MAEDENAEHDYVQMLLNTQQVTVDTHGQHHSWRPLHLLGGRRHGRHWHGRHWLRRLSRLRWNLHLEGLASGEARRDLHSHEPRRCLHLQRLPSREARWHLHHHGLGPRRDHGLGLGRDQRLGPVDEIGWEGDVKLRKGRSCRRLRGLRGLQVDVVPHHLTW